MGTLSAGCRAELVQVSEDAKQGLDEETKRKTQEMADAAYKQRWKMLGNLRF